MAKKSLKIHGSEKKATDDKRHIATFHSPNIINTASGPIRRTGQATSFTGGTFSGAAQSMAQSPLYYDYRWSTPDKFYFPRNRVVANSIWREMYKRDSTVSIATDTYSELPWSSFDVTGIDDGNIRKVYEDMFNELNLVPKMPGFTKDYLITGELILHAMFNSQKGYWSKVIPHNCDYIRAEGVGLMLDQPLLWMRPTPEIRRLITSTDPRIRKLQQLLPKELVNSFRINQEVPLDPLNTTFIARLNNSTDIRGTSLFTRLFRIVMYEDFVANASLAVAQRNAAPLRIFKLGSKETGWLASEEDEAALSEMLSMAESDPLAAIIMHHDLTVDLVGVSDRVLLISKEWDFIERVKLLALGMSKALLIGESSFASAIAGLQILIERLASLRDKFEKEWIIKKLCEPIAKMHGFYEKKHSNVENRIMIHKEEDKLLIPKMKWKKSLDPSQDPALLSVWRDLKEKGILSDRTYSSGSGVDLDVERKNIKEEKEYAEKVGKPKEETPSAGESAPPPPVPGAAKKSASVNEQAFNINDIEDRLLEMADKKNKIDIDDVLDILKEAKSEEKVLVEKLSKVESALPVADGKLLTGI